MTGPTPTSDSPAADLPAAGAEAASSAAAAAARAARILARLRTLNWWGPFSRMPVVAWRLGLGWLAGQAMAVLTTTGRRTGRPRRTVTACIPIPDSGRVYVVAMYGPGSQWFRNLIADPRVTVQTTGPPRAMLARRVADDAELRDAYADLRARLSAPGADALLGGLGAPGGLEGLLAYRDRVLLVRLDPTDPTGMPAAPAIRADLVWVPPLAALAAALWQLLRRRPSRQ